MKNAQVSALVILTLAAVGCRDDARPTAPASLETAVGVNNGSVQAVVVVEPGATAERAVLTVRVLSKDLVLGAYQGAMTFDAGAFELVSSSVPTGVDAQFHIINTEHVAEGVIRFAGFTTEKFAGDEAFRLTVKPNRPLGTVHFIARLEVAGGNDGVALRAEHLQAGIGLRDARSGELIGN